MAKYAYCLVCVNKEYSIETSWYYLSKNTTVFDTTNMKVLATQMLKECNLQSEKCHNVSQKKKQ